MPPPTWELCAVAAPCAGCGAAPASQTEGPARVRTGEARPAAIEPVRPGASILLVQFPERPLHGTTAGAVRAAGAVQAIPIPVHPGKRAADSSDDESGASATVPKVAPCAVPRIHDGFSTLPRPDPPRVPVWTISGEGAHGSTVGASAMRFRQSPGDGAAILASWRGHAHAL